MHERLFIINLLYTLLAYFHNFLLLFECLLTYKLILLSFISVFNGGRLGIRRSEDRSDAAKKNSSSKCKLLMCCLFGGEESVA